MVRISYCNQRINIHLKFFIYFGVETSINKMNEIENVFHSNINYNEFVVGLSTSKYKRLEMNCAVTFNCRFFFFLNFQVIIRFEVVCIYVKNVGPSVEFARI